MNHSILVVEDSPTQAMLLKKILVNRNYRVEVATDGEKAIQWLLENKASLVISDIIMPGMDGFSLCREIKSRFSDENLSVILLTSLNGTDEVIEGLNAGADSFIIKPYDQDYLISHIEKLLAEKAGVQIEKISFGTEIIFGGKKRVIQADQQQIVKLLLNIYEGSIEQNKRLLEAQENLQTLNENLESLVDERTEELGIQNSLLSSLINSPGDIIIFALDRNYCYTTFNENHRREMKKIWNADIREGVNILDCMSIPELKTVAKQSIDHALNGEFLTEIQHQPGVDIYYEFNWNPILQNNEVAGVTVFIKDISERKRVEFEIQSKNEQLEKLNAEKDKFFSIIAHDLRSPLSAFLGFTEMMVEDLPNMKLDDLQKMAVSMQSSAENLYRLLENLLEWAKIQRGLVSYDPEVFSLLSITNESLTMVQELAQRKSITIHSDISGELKVFVDSNILQTVLRNLISNALKFTPKGGKVSLEAKKSGTRQVEISVKDSGIGMSPALLKNLFEISSKSNRKGTDGEPSSGLGLILCKEFVGKLGGKIWVESEEGKGSEFSFTIPLNVIPEQTSDQTESALDHRELIKADGLNVLIADDDEGSGEIYCKKENPPKLTRFLCLITLYSY